MKYFNTLFGLWALLFGVPLYVASIVQADAPAGLFVVSGLCVATGVACLFAAFRN